MAASYTRGKWLYFAIAIPVALLEISSLALTLVGPWNEIAWLRQVAVPVMMLYFCYALWFGGDSTRRWTGVMLALKGFGPAFLVFVVGRMILKETPPEAAPFAWRFAAIVVGLPLAFAVYYGWAALIVWFSPSFKHFADLQEIKDNLIGVSPFQLLCRKTEQAAQWRAVGMLDVSSGTFLLSDPQYVPGLEITGFLATSAEVYLQVKQMRGGHQRIDRLRIVFEKCDDEVQRDVLGQVAIDSAKLVCVDKADFERDWTEVGVERVGEICTARDTRLLEDLKKRFGFKIGQRMLTTARIRGPVSEELEAEINAYLATQPEYAKHAYLHFSVRTGNSFERAIDVDAWAFLPIGNHPQTQMLACSTGYGDGTYEVIGESVQGRLVAIEIDFDTESQRANMESLLGG